MADDDQGEKTEDATPRRLEEAREKGQVAKSQDLTGALVMLFGFSTLKILGPWIAEGFLAVFRHPLESLDARTDTIGDAIRNGQGGAVEMAVFLVPFLAVVFVLTAAVTALQVGLHLAPKAFELNIDKLNPITGMQRLFGVRSLVKLLTGLAKTTLVGVVLYIVIEMEMPKVMGFMGLFDGENNNSAPIIIYLLDMILWLGIYAGATLTVLGVIDYAYHKWQHAQDLKMTKQEVKDEMKNMEGDPQIKRRRLERARAMAQRRMMDRVPEADVVVTNPTHYAVAIKYSDKDPAPTVIAKGQDNFALKIREIAAANRVPIVEKPELARALYRYAEVEQIIPSEFWGPVAEVLAYVYAIDERRKKRALSDVN